MEESKLKLKLSLEEKTPTLLLGAGFSFGGVNVNGDKLPLGTKLVELLYTKMFVENPPSQDIMDEDGEGAKRYKENNDLKGLCGLLRDENRVEERNEYLTQIFTGASIKKDSKLFNITNYKWSKIFTLNIDCLLEYIYQERSIPYKVWNRDNDDRRNNNSDTLIIKLHGCVNNKDNGYIFDEQEYIDFWNEDNCFLRDFGDAYSKGDMIFIGTEFQEEDLKTIISKYSAKGFDSSGNNYFFIAPNINDVRLKRQISSKDNFYWIKWTTEDFFDFLNNEITVKKEIRDDLKERGLIILDELYKEKKQNFESRLYTGYESVYNDFFNDWDFIHPGLRDFEKRISNTKRNLVAAIVGKSYVGKSCAAKRVLVDLRGMGYLAFQFSMRSSEYMQRFLDYMQQLPQNTRVVVLFEEASFYYPLIYNFLIKGCPDNIEHFIVLTSDTYANYFAKKDILKDSNCVELFTLDEKISWTYAEEIYEKLKKTQWLNKPEINDDKNSLKRYACATNDLIDFLYNLSHGHGFETHYTDMFSMIEKDVSYRYLQALTILEVLGLNSIPVRIFSTLLKNERTKFNFRVFSNTFEEILVVEQNRIKVRCLRLIQNTVINGTNEENIKDILAEVARQTSGQFNEGDINEWTEIFQRALTVKRILREKLLSVSNIRELLNEVEKYGKKYSFYWIQRGIAAQKEKDFDLADHYFREGVRIRPNSYQARHAMAKNLMERAIEQIEKGYDSYASHYMDEGLKDIKNIIDNPAYSRGYKYSLHALIDMSIKYYDAIGKKIDVNDIEYIKDRILELPKSELDSYIINAIELYIIYCQKHNYKKCRESIMEKHYDKMTNILSMVEDDYLIENLDWEY